jgi:hypothetical protein
MRRFIIHCAVGILLAAGLGYGCESPDTDEQLNEFIERTGGSGSDATDTLDGETDGSNGFCEVDPDAEISDSYIFGIKTALNQDAPIMLFADVTDNGDGTFDLSFQPLARDACPDAQGCGGNEPRTPVGDSIDVPGLSPDDDGFITIALEEVIVDAAANAASGGQIEATINLNVAICGPESLCGSGDIIALSLGGVELTGTTAAVAAADPSKETTDVPPASCEELAAFEE